MLLPPAYAGQQGAQASSPKAAAPAPQVTAQAAAAVNVASSIVLDTVVLDKSGARITGLKPEDFIVSDNKQNQSVTVSEVSAVDGQAGAPLEAYLLIDEINPDTPLVASARNDLTAYFKSIHQLPVPTSLVFLTVSGLRFQREPSRDPAILLANLDANPTTTRTFVDTGYFSFEARREKCLQAMNVLSVKLSQRPGRKLVIWVSPGWGEFIFQSSRMTRKNNEDLFAYEAALTTALQAARITLYSVDPGGTDCNTCTQNSHFKAYLKGPASAGDVDHNDLMLQALATKTGGNVLWGKNNVASMIDECLKDAQGYYVITYPAPTAPRDITFHEVRVQVNKPGAQVRTRWGYFALSSSTASHH
jgi:VWFA-related protein